MQLVAVAAKREDRLHRELLTQAQQIADRWRDGGSDVFDEQLDTLEHECRSHLTYVERGQLWDRVIVRQRDRTPNR